MPGIPYSATLLFNGASIGYVTGIQVESPEAKIVDMTDWRAPVGQQTLVATGERSGGVATVDYLSSALPSTEIGTVGQLVFSSSALSVTRKAILESASVSATTGDTVRGTIRFRLTD